MNCFIDTPVSKSTKSGDGRLKLGFLRVVPSFFYVLCFYYPFFFCVIIHLRLFISSRNNSHFLIYFTCFYLFVSFCFFVLCLLVSVCLCILFVFCYVFQVVCCFLFCLFEWPLVTIP